jgi:hypothetical protein
LRSRVTFFDDGAAASVKRAVHRQPFFYVFGKRTEQLAMAKAWYAVLLVVIP